MELAESIEESVEDITAALTAPEIKGVFEHFKLKSVDKIP